MEHPSHPITRSTRRPAPWTGWLLPAGFIAVAAGLFAAPKRVDIPVDPPGAVDREALVPAPRRVAMTDPAHIMVEGRAQACNGCHQIFDSAHPAGTVLSFHQEIRLSHGLNDRCINCHDAADRERLVLRDGSTVPFADTPVLCAQCHGTVYRDWLRGMHGRTMGSWITGSAFQSRLGCSECHDPHAPRYDAMVPLPGPATLRMGDPRRAAHAHGAAAPGAAGRQSPLQRWLHDLHPSDAGARADVPAPEPGPSEASADPAAGGSR
ncbi:MAG: hypothetical protein KF817_04125 [Phycisphaeraceae bacterium]|nr:hypothetical protein [Phycisphaeraceae bacterium]